MQLLTGRGVGGDSNFILPAVFLNVSLSYCFVKFYCLMSSPHLFSALSVEVVFISLVPLNFSGCLSFGVVLIIGHLHFQVEYCQRVHKNGFKE